MHIAIFGTGAVGGYFGGRLARAGEDVAFIARGAHLQALQANGLRVDSLGGDFLVRPVRATDTPSEIGPVDLVILGVKAWQVPEAAQRAQPLVGPDTIVLPLQNGVEAADQVAAVLGRQHVLGGLCRLIALLAGPGHIRHVGAEPLIEFGELDDRPSDRVERLRRTFAAAGITVRVPKSISAAIWEKFLFIAAFGGVGAVSRAPIGVVRRLPETRALLEACMNEIAQVARARHVPLAHDAVSRSLAILDGFPEDATASMQRDVMSGRPSELFGQNGAVVRLAQEAGVETPVNRFICQALLPLELEARGELSDPSS